MTHTDPAAQNLIAALLTDFSNTALLGQIMALLIALGVSWLTIHKMERHQTGKSREIWHTQEWKRFLIPLFTLLLTLIVRPFLARLGNPHLLDIAIPLLLSLFIVQLSLFFLRSLFHPGALLTAIERAVSWLIWIIVAIHITGYLGTVEEELDSIGFNIGKQHISLYTALLGLFTTALTLISALSLGRLLENRLIATSNLNSNLKAALSKIIRTLLVLVAVLIALPLVGIDITVLSVFSGALGVGLGLGLQKVASNYVSGFTLLLENSIHIGDMVTVNNLYGEVSKIATRYTVIRSLDGSETVIPNDTLITSAVTNHSLTSPDNMVSIPIQVAYETDLRQAEAVMLEAARSHPDVLQEPTPVVRLTDFGDNGINLKLAVWFKHPESGSARLVSDLNWAIWEDFRKAGIDIPFPQRVVRLLKD
ncbi:MAG TPA: mechanosensitive ion channel domain-containing protein [Parasulfuritortus sp.]